MQSIGIKIESCWQDGLKVLSAKSEIFAKCITEIEIAEKVSKQKLIEANRDSKKSYNEVIEDHEKGVFLALLPLHIILISTFTLLGIFLDPIIPAVALGIIYGLAPALLIIFAIITLITGLSARIFAPKLIKQGVRALERAREVPLLDMSADEEPSTPSEPKVILSFGMGPCPDY